MTLAAQPIATDSSPPAQAGGQRWTTCRYVRGDGSHCAEPAVYDVRYFMPGDDERPRRSKACEKHLGRLVAKKMHGGANTCAIYHRKQSTMAEQ